MRAAEEIRGKEVGLKKNLFCLFSSLLLFVF